MREFINRVMLKLGFVPQVRLEFAEKRIAVMEKTIADERALIAGMQDKIETLETARSRMAEDNVRLAQDAIHFEARVVKSPEHFNSKLAPMRSRAESMLEDDNDART